MLVINTVGSGWRGGGRIGWEIWYQMVLRVGHMGDTVVEVDMGGLVGLWKDKVSLHNCFGLQTEENICINLSTMGSPLWRGMQEATGRRVGRERTRDITVIFKERLWSYSLEIKWEDHYQLESQSCVTLVWLYCGTTASKHAAIGM